MTYVTSITVRRTRKTVGCSAGVMLITLSNFRNKVTGPADNEQAFPMREAVVFSCRMPICSFVEAATRAFKAVFDA